MEIKLSEGGPKRLDQKLQATSNEQLSLIVSLEEGSYKCTTCGKIYKQRASSLKHVNANHGLADTTSLTRKVCETKFVFEG